MKRVFFFLAALLPLVGADTAYATVTTPNCDQIEAYGRSASPASDDVLNDFFGQPPADISSHDISTLQQAALDCSEDESDNESNAPNLDLAIRKLEALRPLVQLFEDQKTPSASTADTDPSCAALAPPSDGDIADTQFQQMARDEESGKALANIYSSGGLELYYARKKRETCAALNGNAPEQNGTKDADVAAAIAKLSDLAKEVAMLPNDAGSLNRLAQIDKDADRILGWNSGSSGSDLRLLETEYNKVHGAVQNKSRKIRSNAATPQSQVIAGPASELTKFTDIERLAIALGVSWGNSMQMEKVRKALVENGVDLLGIVNLVTEVEDGWLIQITAAPGQQRSDDNGIFCFVKSDDAASVNVLGSLNLYSTVRFTAELNQWDVDFGARRMRIVFSPCKVSAQ